MVPLFAALSLPTAECAFGPAGQTYRILSATHTATAVVVKVGLLAGRRRRLIDALKMPVPTTILTNRGVGERFVLVHGQLLDQERVEDVRTGAAAG